MSVVLLDASEAVEMQMYKKGDRVEVLANSMFCPTGIGTVTNVSKYRDGTISLTVSLDDTPSSSYFARQDFVVKLEDNEITRAIE